MHSEIQAPPFARDTDWTTQLHYSFLSTKFIYLANMPRSKSSGRGLSILPYLIARSDYIVSTFSRHRRFIPEIKRFHQRSKVLAVHLRDELRLILSRVTEFRTAEDMLENPKHCLWSNAAVLEGLIQYLGSSYDLCLEVVEQLSQELENIAKECLALDAMESPDPNIIVCFPHVHNFPCFSDTLTLLTS